MEATIDPATGQPLPADAIQRVLHIAHPIHVYNIPPLTSSRGHAAASWTEDPKRHIFTCRLRIIETAVPDDSSSGGGTDRVKVDVVLEDPSTGQLFAAAPYSSPAVVEPTADSSRFFALRVQDPAGRKATLGIGFEERGEAFDFGVALQEAQKALGMLAPGGEPGRQQQQQQQNQQQGGKAATAEDKRDYSLKEGETITVNLSGTKFGRNRVRPPPQQQSSAAGETVSLSSFALPPPPGSSSAATAATKGASGFLPKPPSAQEVRAQKRMSAQQLGFDDGQFGEFA